ncbi:MAG: VOC family protein [Halieaceae bacterium]|nr:VOC family protein [Halieaceae bacterium]
MKRICASLLLTAVVLTACSATGVSIPALEGSLASERLPGKIIWHELITDTPEQTQRFYTELFGWEFEPLSDKNINYFLIRQNGKAIGGMINQNRLPTKADISQWVALFSVTDIAAATDQVASSGGTVFTPPTSLGDRGKIAVVADPQGALFALLQTANGDPADTAEPASVGDFFWHELWTGDIDRAVTFYGKLAPYQMERRNLGTGNESIDYVVMQTQQQKRGGIRANPFKGLPPIWVNYLQIPDDAELDRILAKVESLGGEILVPAASRPSGGTVAMIAGPSGAGIALQTWTNEEQLAKFGEQ